MTICSELSVVTRIRNLFRETITPTRMRFAIERDRIEERERESEEFTEKILTRNHCGKTESFQDLETGRK